MTYRIISRNIRTNESEILAEVQGLDEVSEAIMDIVFDDDDIVEEWSFEILPIL